jgi:nucleoside-diphosphate-sugar epimerase
LCILRLTALYGPGDTHNAYGPNRFVRTAINDGRILIYGKGEELRSFVFIDDVIKIISLVLFSRSTCTFNVAINPAISFQKIALKISNLIDKPIIFDYLPRTIPIIHRPYKSTQVFRFLYNFGRPISQVVHRTFVNTSLIKAFPSFTFTPMEAGLSSFLAIEKNNPPVFFSKSIFNKKN